MTSPTHHASRRAIAADLSDASALLVASLVNAAGAANATNPKVNVEAKLYAAAVVIWSIRRPATAIGGEDGDCLIDLWLADLVRDLGSENIELFVKAVDNRTAQYVVLWEAGDDWAINTARFLDANMAIEADAATLSALAHAAAAGREGVDRFVQSAFQAP